MAEFNSLPKIKRLHAEREERRSQIPIEPVDVDQMMNDISFLILSIDRFDKKMTEKKCNAGHDNTLPLYLWDCPTCTEILREDIIHFKKEKFVFLETFSQVTAYAEHLHREKAGEHFLSVTVNKANRLIRTINNEEGKYAPMP